MNPNNQINQVIQGLLQMKNAGRNPQQVMQMLMQRNPNYQQAMTTLQNMAQGRNPQEFIMQLAKQNGVSQENLQAIQGLFGNK